MKTAEQLKPYQFKPGVSGNPTGRAGRDPGITPTQIALLDRPCAEAPALTWRQWLAMQGLILAGKTPQAAEALKDRLEGRVPSRIELEANVIQWNPDQLLEASRLFAVVEAQETKLLADYVEAKDANG